MRPSPTILIQWVNNGSSNSRRRVATTLIQRRHLSSTSPLSRQQQQQQQQQFRAQSSLALQQQQLDYDDFAFLPDEALPHVPPSPKTSNGGGGGGSSNNNNGIVHRRPLYVSATRQHVGKTTTSLALVSGLQKRVGQIGFMKPVGQKALPVKDDRTGEELMCDKDAVLVRHHFGLDHLSYQSMNPVLIPQGYTKAYVDGKITKNQQQTQVLNAYNDICSRSNIVLCEGTGHTAVGSIVDASNAEVAAWLGARMVLVANGGLGHALDELELNKVFCDKFGVQVAGVIINKVIPEKYEQTRYYLTKALQERWGLDVPLLGLIPDRPFLGCPAVADLEKLFQGSRLVSGHAHRYRHYTVKSDTNLVTTSLEVFLRNVRSRDSNRTLYVVHASRNDILLGFLMEAQQRHKKAEQDQSLQPWEAAVVVTGCDEYPVCPQVLEMLNPESSSPPILLTPYTTDKVMEELHRFTPKLHFEDGRRVDAAITHYEDFIDFDLLLERATVNDNETGLLEQA